MAKRVVIFLVLLFVIAKLFAQGCDSSGYSYAYWFNGIPSSIPTNILPGKAAGTTLLFGNVQLNYKLPNTNYAFYLTSLNSRGTPIQTQTFNYNGNAYIYDACQNPSGGYFVTGFTSLVHTGGVPWIAKLNAAGYLVWSFGMNTPTGTFYKVAATPDGGCVAVGTLALSSETDPNGAVVRPYSHAIVSKLDSTGQVIWGKEFYTAQEVEQAYQVFSMRDGSVILTGVKNNGPNAPPGSDNFVIKLDKDDGHTIWQKTTHVYFGQVTETNDGNLLFRQSNYLYFINSKDGTAMLARSFMLPQPYNGNYNLQYGGAFPDGADLYYDFVGLQNILLFKMYNYDSIALVTNLQGGSNYGNDGNPVSVLIQQKGTAGLIYICGGLASQGLATHDSTEYEGNAFLHVTSLNGQSSCTSNLNIQFSFDTASLPELDDFNWYGYGDLSFNTPIPLSFGAQVPVSGVVCHADSCCLDTTTSITDTMCLGGSYTLPNGTAVYKAGLYPVVLKRSSGCDSIVFVTITTVPPAKPALGTDTCFITASPIVLKANATFASSYLWQNGSTDSTYSATQPGSYWVQTSNLCGTLADTIIIYPQCALPVFVPSAFTPNGDGVNDVFRIADLKGQKLLDFSIYNRWGLSVFRTEDVQQGWDGTVGGHPSPTGAYVYLIHYEDMTGKSMYTKGTFVLLR
jgi:gliding motility-associated-like protein